MEWDNKSFYFVETYADTPGCGTAPIGIFTSPEKALFLLNESFGPNIQKNLHSEQRKEDGEDIYRFCDATGKTWFWAQKLEVDKIQPPELAFALIVLGVDAKEDDELGEDTPDQESSALDPLMGGRLELDLRLERDASWDAVGVVDGQSPESEDQDEVSKEKTK